VAVRNKKREKQASLLFPFFYSDVRGFFEAAQNDGESVAVLFDGFRSQYGCARTPCFVCGKSLVELFKARGGRGKAPKA
jgi:hypothetical protein